MKKIYLVYVLPLFAISCTSSRIDYVGSSHSPTQHVDVYVDERAIPRNYIIMGKGYEKPNRIGNMTREKLLKMAIVKARQQGADAVFYNENYIPVSGTNLSSYSRTDSVKKGTISFSNTAIAPIIGTWHMEILFLKYK